jgi:hypothetical protein
MVAVGLGEGVAPIRFQKTPIDVTTCEAVTLLAFLIGHLFADELFLVCSSYVIVPVFANSNFLLFSQNT